MKNIIIKDILKITKGKLIIGNENEICTKFSKDTRQIKENDTYIGIKGETFDGNIFWDIALDNGAKCVIIENINFENINLEKYDEKNKIIILVEDTLEALYEIAKFKRSIYNIPVIAITGSVGKTSTKDVVANVVSQKYKTLKTIGNLNNNIGMPFTILELEDHEAMILEMGMNHLGEISLLSKIAKPDICVITNVGTAHIGNLGSRENILKAKMEILDGTDNPKVVINLDNDMLKKWYEENRFKYNITTYSINEDSNLKAENIVLSEECSKFEYNYQNKTNVVNVPIAGEHFILNALSAIAVGQMLGIEEKNIIEGIEKFELTAKRMEIFNTKYGVKIINDAYNASYDSIIASIKTLSSYEKNRKIAILGDMKELGEFSKEIHQNVGKYIKDSKIDILICGGKDAKYISNEVLESLNNKIEVYYCTDNIQIVDKVCEISTKGDVILLKASNGMRFFEIADKLKEKI